MNGMVLNFISQISSAIHHPSSEEIIRQLDPKERLSRYSIQYDRIRMVWRIHVLWLAYQSFCSKRERCEETCFAHYWWSPFAFFHENHQICDGSRHTHWMSSASYYDDSSASGCSDAIQSENELAKNSLRLLPRNKCPKYFEAKICIAGKYKHAPSIPFVLICFRLLIFSKTICYLLIAPVGFRKLEFIHSISVLYRKIDFFNLNQHWRRR